MKRLLASILILSLSLAACSHDDGNSNKEDTNKSEQHDGQKTDKNKQKDKKDKKSNVQKDDDEQATNDSKDNSSEKNSNKQNNASQSQSGAQQGQAINQNNQANNNKGQSHYVKPYQSPNAAYVSRQLTIFNGNENTALKQLPNFKNALTKANQEVNKIHQMQCQYNDYAIQSHNGRYEYLFSFKNPKQQGTYTIVSVNGQGQPSIIEPAYQPK